MLGCRRCSRDLSRGIAAEAAGAAVAEAEADAGEARCREVGSVAAAAVVVESGLEAAHSVVAGHPVVEGSAVAVAAVLAQEETMGAEDMIVRLAEAQSTAVDRVVGLHCISVMSGNCQSEMAYHIHPSPVVL